jgi:hypothetical protein
MGESTNAAEWLAAIGTVGALGVSLVVLAFELRSRRKAEWDRRTETPSKVVAWVTHRSHSEPGPAGTTYYWRLTYRNRSNSMIYDVAITAERGWIGTSEILQLPLLPPGEEKVDLEIEVDPPMPSAPVDGVPLLWIDFTDDRGQRWRRETTGALRQLGARKRPY